MKKFIKRLICLIKGHDYVWDNERIDLLAITIERKKCLRCYCSCLDRIIY